MEPLMTTKNLSRERKTQIRNSAYQYAIGMLSDVSDSWFMTDEDATEQDREEFKVVIQNLRSQLSKLA